MNKLFLFTFVITLFVSFTPSASAQDTGDPYDDYSYLWEKDKKKKKKKKDETEIQEPAVTTQDTLVQDSLTNEQTAATDSLPDQPPSQVAEDIQEEAAEEEVKAKKEKKERKDLPPINDFRTPLPSGGAQSQVNAGFSATQIGGQWYVGMVLFPEFKIWKIGLGLNVPILYGLDDKSIRTEIFEGGVGAARLVRYLRYGNQKQDPVYVKVGELNNTMIGYGGLINNYTNTTSFEKRKIGIHYDLNFRTFIGVEGMYSDFDPQSFNLFAVRPYLRPLALTGIPVVRTFEMGATWARDRDQTKIPLTDSTSYQYTFTEPGVGGLSFDAGITVLSVPFIQVDLFSTYNILKVKSDTLVDYIEGNPAVFGNPKELNDGYKDGTGFSYGINFRFHFIADLLSTDVRIERLTYTEHYLPQFFNAEYELQKDSRILGLANAPAMSGVYGSLVGHILHKVQLGGSLMIPDDISEESPALVRVHGDVERLADKFSLHASYIKGNLADLKDAFKLDEQSLAKARFIYHMNKFLAVGMDYYWAFALAEDGTYKATQYFSPYFGLSIAF